VQSPPPKTYRFLPIAFPVVGPGLLWKIALRFQYAPNRCRQEGESDGAERRSFSFSGPPHPARIVSPRPRLSKGWSSPCSPCSPLRDCAWLRVGPVPAAPLLTGCGRYDLTIVQRRDKEQGFSGPNKEQDQEEQADRLRLHRQALHEWKGRKEAFGMLTLPSIAGWRGRNKEAWRGVRRAATRPCASWCGQSR
jgi:hypothetical protein